jgi:hypothetical protein
MAVNKVIYGTTVLVDLTQDSVTADALVEGKTAHGADGEPITGTNPYAKAETDATVNEQADLIERIKTALARKESGVVASLQDMTITRNGVYTADDNHDGLGRVVVNVESGGGGGGASLTEFLDGTMTSISDENATYVRDYLFAYCVDLVSVDLPSVTHICSSAFECCESLSIVNIPSVTEIYYGAFATCPIESIDLPSVTFMEYGAFTYCFLLNTVIIRTEDQVCGLDGWPFEGCESLTNIYVPDSLVQDYKAADYWSDYADLITPLSEL